MKDPGQPADPSPPSDPSAAPDAPLYHYTIRTPIAVIVGSFLLLIAIHVLIHQFELVDSLHNPIFIATVVFTILCPIAWVLFDPIEVRLLEDKITVTSSLFLTRNIPLQAIKILEPLPDYDWIQNPPYGRRFHFKVLRNAHYYNGLLSNEEALRVIYADDSGRHDVLLTTPDCEALYRRIEAQRAALGIDSLVRA